MKSVVTKNYEKRAKEKKKRHHRHRRVRGGKKHRRDIEGTKEYRNTRTQEPTNARIKKTGDAETGGRKKIRINNRIALPKL